jgi:hypothetical protein
MKIVLYVLICQGFLGCFDVFWNHEWKENLPGRLSAAREQQIHGARELLYAAIFIGLAWYSWHGGWALAIAGLLAVEILLTAWDFIVEDKTRILGPNERVLHLLLSMGGGAYVALLVPELLHWAALPAALQPANYGVQSWLLTMLGAGVFIWGIRDAWSGIQLARLRQEPQQHAVSA